MAAHIFPNSIVIEGFPTNMTQYDFLLIFGGSKGHINEVEITYINGKPKAFIQYKHVGSLPLALKMKGLHLFNHPYPLKVQVVDERVLCDHVPGEMYSAGEALANLQRVLFSVLASRDHARSAYRINTNHLTQVNEQSQAKMNELRKNFELYKVEKAEEKREMDSNLLQVVAQRDKTIDRCAKLEAENRDLEEQVKEAGKFERESTSELTAQLQRITGHCTQLQTEIDTLKTRLMEVDSELRAEQHRNDSESKELEDLRQDLKEATAQKERTIDRLGMANNSVLRLLEELKMTQETAEVSQSSLERTRSALEGMDNRVRTLQAYVTQTHTKRERAEEDLIDEREPKRRLIEERGTIETRCRARADEAEKHKAERQQLEERLQMETHHRKRAEESLVEAKAMLDRVVVTDSLTAAFLKFDQIAVEVVEELSPPDGSSTSP